MNNDQPFLDKDALDELKLVMEDDFQMLVTTFLSDGKDRLIEIERTVASGVADDVRRSAHSLKGSSSNIGAVRLSSACYVLEQAGANEDLTGSSDLLDNIKAVFSETDDKLKSEYL